MSESANHGGLEPFDPALNHFERLGLTASIELEREGLESRYLEASARVHPDRHQGRGEGQQRLAMEHASAINQAYRVLRSPIKRYEYLVKLGGVDLDSSSAQGGAPKPSQAFLIDMIERREALEAAAGEGAEALEDLRDELETESRRLLAQAKAALVEEQIELAATHLVAHRYLRRLNEEIEGQLDSESEGGSR